MKVRIGMGLLVALWSMLGCVGASPRISFDESRYPISMTEGLLDGQGRAIGRAAYTWKASYQASAKGWAMGYTKLPLGKVDLSEDLNEKVEAAGGNAVVRLTVQAPFTFCSFVNMVQVTGLVPFYTGCAPIFVEADIVEVH